MIYQIPKDKDEQDDTNYLECDEPVSKVVSLAFTADMTPKAHCKHMKTYHRVQDKALELIKVELLDYGASDIYVSDSSMTAPKIMIILESTRARGLRAR